MEGMKHGAPIPARCAGRGRANEKGERRKGGREGGGREGGRNGRG